MDTKEASDKFIKTYHAMLEQVKDLWHNAEEKALPTLSENIEQAAEKASELGELTKEEVEKIGEYVQRDLEDAGEYLSDYFSQNSSQLESWLKDELEIVENQFTEIFSTLADKTRIELDVIAEQARQVGVWHTGENTYVGTLYCKNCNEALHFDKPSVIPPCPKCKGTEFKKVLN